MSNEKALRANTANSPHDTGIQDPLQQDSNLYQELWKKDFSVLYKCKSCEMNYSDKRGIYVHLQTHSGSKVYECTDCRTSFRNVNDLLFHLDLYKKNNLKCTQCSATFQSVMNLAKHLASHDYERLYQCLHCEYFTHYQCAITRHLKTHTERSFKCDICGKTYRHKRSLEDHIHLRCEDKKFKCTDCNKNFPNSKSLQMHINSKKEHGNTIVNQSKHTEVVCTIPSSVRCSSEVENFSGPVNQFGQESSSFSAPEISSVPATGEHSHNGREVKQVPERPYTSETSFYPGDDKVSEMSSPTMKTSEFQTEFKSGPVGDSPKFYGIYTFDEIPSLTGTPSFSGLVDDSSLWPQSEETHLDDLEELYKTELSSAPWANFALEPYLDILYGENIFPPQVSSIPGE